MVLGVSPGWGGFGGEAFGEVVDHRDGDHAGGVVGSGFVVAYEAAVVHEPAQRALDHPSTFDHAEAFRLRVVGDDLDVDAQAGTVFDELVLETGIDPRLGQGGVGGGGLVEEVHADRVVADVGGSDDDGEQQAEGVGDDPSL